MKSLLLAVVWTGTCLVASEADPLASVAPHPRLLVTDAQLSAIATAPADALRTQLKTYIYGMATKADDTAIESAATIMARFRSQYPTPGEYDWRGMGLRTARRVQGQIWYWAMASRIAALIDHDSVRSKTWGQRAIRQMMTVAAADFSWDPGRGVVLAGQTTPLNGQYLNVAEMAFGVALGYDWLYANADWWVINGVDQRPVVARALYTKALDLGYDAYGASPSNYTDFWVTGRSNWTQVCNGGMLAAATALAGEAAQLSSVTTATELDAVVRLTLRGACSSLAHAQSMYAPAGVYPEGLGYWNYGTGYQVLGIALLESALGASSPFVQQQVEPLWNTPGFQATAWYRSALVGPSGVGFSYADTGYQVGVTSRNDDPSLPLTWLTTRFHLPALQAVNRRNLERDSFALPTSIDDTTYFNTSAYPLHFVWLDQPGSTTSSTGPQDRRFGGKPLEARADNTVELAVFRNSSTDSTSWWVALKGGANGLGHSHADLGSFVMDYGGVRWAEDLGADDYGLPGYSDDEDGGARWKYLLCGVQGHNLLNLGERQQALVAQAPITGFSATPTHAWTAIDLSALAPDLLTRHHRGLELIDQRQQLLVQDDLQGLIPGVPLSWRFMTAANATLDAAHPRTVTLTRTRGATTITMLLEVLSPATATVAVEAVSSIQNGSRSFPGYSRVTVQVPSSSTTHDAQVVVRLRPSTRAATAVAMPRPLVWQWTPDAGVVPDVPVITSPRYLPVTPGGLVDVAITATDGPWSAFTAAPLPAWLHVDAATGRCFGTVPADFAAPLALRVGATNAAGTGTTELTLAPAERVLPLLTHEVIRLRLGTPMSAVGLVTTDVPTNPWFLPLQTLHTSAVPPGLTISERGRLSGTPTCAGRFVVALRAQNLYGTVTESVTIEVADGTGTVPAAMTATPTILQLP